SLSTGNHCMFTADGTVVNNDLTLIVVASDYERLPVKWIDLACIGPARRLDQGQRRHAGHAGRGAGRGRRSSAAAEFVRPSHLNAVPQAPQGTRTGVPPSVGCGVVNNREGELPFPPGASDAAKACSPQKGLNRRRSRRNWARWRQWTHPDYPNPGD